MGLLAGQTVHSDTCTATGITRLNTVDTEKGMITCESRMSATLASTLVTA